MIVDFEESTSKAQLLLTLDGDGDPNNGIEINETTRNVVKKVDSLNNLKHNI